MRQQGRRLGPRSLDPLIIAFVGAPLWWLLGLFQAMFFIASAVMLLRLARMRHVTTPRLFTVWLFFLLWALGGLFTLQVDAPGAVPGESLGRYVTFAYRYAWAVAGAIVLLYIMNTRRTLSSQAIAQALSWFFVVLVGGGLIGLLFPMVDFPSLLEALLPTRISQIPLAQELIHPSTAQVQSVLGEPQARPSAPFAYTNEWGLAVALTLPFFVDTWWRMGTRRRYAMAVILSLGAIPIVDSLNRGLWLALLIVAAFTALRSAYLGNVRTFLTLAALGLVAGLVVLASPLGGTVQERIDTPHSDEGRANLSLHTVNSALEGSPVIGFGTTRDVAGNFNSIAGGASAVCPGCEPPPMGTHGQAWLLIFTTGVGGLLLYLALLGGYFVRHIRARAPESGPPLAALLTALVTMPIYNSTGASLIIVFTAIGLLARLEPLGPHVTSAPTLASLRLPLRRGAWLMLVGVTLGTSTGLLVHASLGAPATASQSVLVPAATMVGEDNVRELTLDSEAELATSHRVIERVGEETGLAMSDIDQRLVVGAAAPNTRVLTLSYTDRDGGLATQAVDVAVTEYLALRADLHSATEEDLERRRVRQYDSLNAAYTDLASTLSSTNFVSTSAASVLARIRDEIVATSGPIDTTETPLELGTRVTGMTVTRTNDALMVRLGSSVIVGAVGGILLAYLWGMRRAGSGRGNLPTEVMGLRTVAVRYEKDRQKWEQTYTRRLRSFPPVGALVPDPGSAEAVEIGNFLEATLPLHGMNARRTLLLISTRTTLHEIKTMLATCRAMRLRPVGIVLVGTQSH